MGSDRSIGRGGDLIWHLRDDLRHFKAVTMGHPVIMGRKTWESLPKGALPGRLNIVLSRDPHYNAPGATVCTGLDQALELAAQHDGNPFIIGGGSIYADTLAMADRLYITEIEAVCPDADTFFPPVDPDSFAVTEQDAPQNIPDGTPRFRFVTYERK